MCSLFKHLYLNEQLVKIIELEVDEKEASKLILRNGKTLEIINNKLFQVRYDKVRRSLDIIFLIANANKLTTVEEVRKHLIELGFSEYYTDEEIKLELDEMEKETNDFYSQCFTKATEHLNIISI